MSRKSRWLFEASASGLANQMFMAAHGSKPLLICVCEHRFHKSRRWRFDCCIPELKIAAEYHGGLFMERRGGHQSVKGARRDWEKLNEAQMMGFMVLQFGPDETRSGEALEVIQRAIEARKQS